MHTSRHIVLAICCLLALVYGLQAQQYHHQQHGNIIRLEVLPGDITVKTGDPLQFTVIAYTQDNTGLTPTNVNWMGLGGTINQTGFYQAGNVPGPYIITVTYGKLQATARVQVKTVAPPIVKLIINPPQANIFVGNTVQFTAVAYNMFNQPVPFTPIWTVNAGGAMIDGNGVFRAHTPGQFMVTLTPQNVNISATAMVTVTEKASLTRIVINPENSQTYINQPLQFTAIGYDNYGRQMPCNVIWSANGGMINPDTGSYTAPPMPSACQIIARDRMTGAQGVTTVNVLPLPGPMPQPGGDARIVITNVDIGGNFLTPKIKMSLEVYGHNIQTVRLYAVSTSNRLSELDAQNCKNGDKIYFKAEFNSLDTKCFEVKLFDRQGTEVARTTRNR